MFLAEIEALLDGVHNIDAPQILMQTTVKKALERIESPHDREVCYRASSIGKPWITQVLDRWANTGVYSEIDTRSIGSLMVMTDGVVCQAWVETVLDLCRVEYESEVTLKRDVGGITIVGHSDIVVRKGNQIIVFECKSMAPHLITEFARLPHDDYGYLSQLSFYTECVRAKYPLCSVSGAFILYNRGVGAFKVVPITSDVIATKNRRIDTALVQLESITQGDVETLIDTVLIPPAVNGKIPVSMRYSRWVNCIYSPSTEYGKFKVRDRDDMIQLITKALYK